MVHFGVLGPLSADRAGEPLTVPSGRARLLLGALLVSQGSAVSIDELLDRLWGELPPRTAVTALHGHVSRLRKVLRDDVLLTTPSGYRLAVPVEQIDSGRFRSMVAQANRERVASERSSLLRAALRLWRGAAFADFCYEPFAQSEIAALEEMRITATEDAIDADLVMGRHGTLVAELQSLVLRYPLRERLSGQLMIALYGSGRQAEALAAYQEARARMIDELGVDPGPTLRALEAAILRQDPTLVVPIPLHERGHARKDDRVIRRVDRADAAFVGRTIEIDQLHATLARVIERRRATLVTLVGEPGVGKSRLAKEFAASLGDGTTLLMGMCVPDVHATYSPVHQLLSQVQFGTDDRSRDIVAELRDAVNGKTAVADGHIALAAIRLLAEQAIQGPVLLVLEDLHWAQPGLLDLIEAVAANTDGAVMMLCLARPELFDLRQSFGANAPDAAIVELGPMAPDEVRRLVLDIAEPDAPASAVDEIVSVSEGNPFFATQLVAWGGTAGETARSLPPAVQTLLANRVAQLGPGELAVVQSAAIVGRDGTLAALAALLPDDVKSTVERHVSALARHQLLEPTVDGYRFRHHLVHRTAYLATDPSTRARLHERYADWLVAEPSAAPASADETVGYHLEQAYDNLQTLGMADVHARLLGSRAAMHLGAAGNQAVRRYDRPAAASLLARALRLGPRDDRRRPGLLLDSVWPLQVAGRMSEASTTLLEAIDGARTASDVKTEWRARLDLAWVRASVGSTDRAEVEMLEVAERAIDVLERERDHEGLAFAWMIIGSARDSFGELARAELAFRRALEHARRGPGHPKHGGITWGLASVFLHGSTPVMDAISRCEELVELGGISQTGVLLELSALHAMNGDFGRAREILSRADWELHARGSQRPLRWLAEAQARVELYAGQPQVAEGHSRRGLDVGTKAGADEADSVNAIYLARALCRQSRFDDAEAVIAAHAGTTSLMDVGRSAMLNAVRSEVRTHRGAHADAIELAARAVTDVDRTELLNLRAELRLTLAAALRGVGDAAGAVRVANEALELFRAKGNLVGLAAARTLLDSDAQDIPMTPSHASIAQPGDPTDLEPPTAPS